MGRNYDDFKVRSDMANAIGINVYACSNRDIIVLSKYKAGIHYERKLPLNELHQLTSRISKLISYWNIANTSYVYSRYIDEKSALAVINRGGFIKKSFQQELSYTKVDFFEEATRVRAAFTYRLIKNFENDGFRLIPYIILPKMTKEEGKKLRIALAELLKNGNYLYVNENYFIADEKLGNKRGSNELIIFVLSIALLFEFQKTYGVEFPKMEDDIEKLADNFSSPKVDSLQVIKELIEKPIIKDCEGIISVLRKALDAGTCFRQGARYSAGRNIERMIEDDIFRMGKEDEAKAYKLGISGSYITISHDFRAIELSDFITNYGWNDLNSLREIISYTLLLMDTGTASASTVAGDKQTTDTGLQFLRAGELALLIPVMRMYEYIPLCAVMYNYCNRNIN